MNDDDDDYVDELPAGPRRTIPEADRELLELAARALGAVRFEEVDGEDYANLYFEDGSTSLNWNPLLFSDNTFELAVNLNLHIHPSFGDEFDFVCVGVENPDRDQYLDPEESKWLAEEKGNGDPKAATRRAVTRAAAEIGKAMAQSDLNSTT